MIRRIAQLAQGVFHESGAGTRILEDGYTRVDPFAVAAHAGVTVLLRPLDKLLGAFIREKTAGILVNVQRSAGLVHMTCAHELGHFFNGHETTADETIDYGKLTSIKEQEAEFFAYQLLTPRLVLATAMRRKGWTTQSFRNPLLVYQLSLRLGISYTAAIWSLKRHTLIDYATANKLQKILPADIKRSLVRDELLNPHKEVWLLDEGDQSSILEPRTDDQLVLRLKSHASAGYIWSPKELAAEGFQIQPIKGNRTHTDDLSALTVGGQGTYDFVLSPKLVDEVDTDHAVRFALEERRPWTKSAKPSGSYQATALFEHLQPGLTGEAKRQLLQEIQAA
jgi:Zn-dependent peptidase ImmA (M78 family)